MKMKKLLFLTFILTACAVQNELANGNTITPPESGSPGSSEPTPTVQTTRDEWIQLVRGRMIINTLNYFRDNGAFGPANASKLYIFCGVAEGQNKAVYKYYYYHGFEVKNNVLYIYSENYNLGNGWTDLNQIIFDQNNPSMSAEAYILN